MKNSIAVLALGGLLTLGMGAVVAQEAPAPDAQAAPMRGMHRMDPNRQLARLTRVLSLTSAQQDQIRPLLADRQQKMQALMQDQSLDQKARRTEMKTINDGTQNGIVAVLNDDQKQKYAQMREEMKDRMRERRGGMDTTAPESAPQTQPQS
jgi:periplasmic protein CpxP/Spy